MFSIGKKIVKLDLELIMSSLRMDFEKEFNSIFEFYNLQGGWGSAPKL